MRTAACRPASLDNPQLRPDINISSKQGIIYDPSHETPCSSSSWVRERNSGNLFVLEFVTEKVKGGGIGEASCDMGGGGPIGGGS